MTATTSPPGAQLRARPAVRTRLTGEGLLQLIVAGGIVPLLIWWRNTPTVHGLGDWLTNAGRLTGLAGGYTIVVVLLLMARVPAIERGIGSHRLARLHAYGGRCTVSLVTAHTLLVVWGYAVTAHTGLVAQTGSLLVDYPDVLMATVGLGLFLLVAGVSMRAARRRIRYETWYYLHFYTYLAVALSFAHAFATGAEFMNSLAARIYWSALYVGVAVLLAVYRFAIPLAGVWRRRAVIADVRREAAGVVSLYVTGKELHRLDARAGQFFRLRLLTRDGWWQSHPYSLSAAPHDRHLRFTVRSVGDYTSTLRRVRRGTRVMLEGPYGALTDEVRTRRKVLLLAGGIGITPLRALLESLPAAPGELTLVYRESVPEELVFRSELDELAVRRGAAVHYAIGPRGSKGDVLMLGRLAGLVQQLAKHDVYLCGPEGFMRAARRELIRSGVPAEHIFTEEFSW